MQCLWREQGLRVLNDSRSPWNRSRVRPRPLAQPHGSILCYPPWGGRGMTECRNPYFTTYPLPRRPAPAPRPALPAIGTPLSNPFDCGATGRAALASWTSSISVGVAPGQPAGTDSRPVVLAWPRPADTGPTLPDKCAPPLTKGARPPKFGFGNQAPAAGGAILGVTCWPMP